MASQDELIRAAIGVLQSREVPAEAVQYLRLAKHNIEKAEGLISGSVPPASRSLMGLAEHIGAGWKALSGSIGGAGLVGWLLTQYGQQFIDLLKDPQAAVAAWGGGAGIVGVLVSIKGWLNRRQ